MYTKQDGIWVTNDSFAKNGDSFQEGPNFAKFNGVYVPTKQNNDPILIARLARSLPAGTKLSGLNNFNGFRFTITKGEVETDLATTVNTVTIGSTPANTDYFLNIYRDSQSYLLPLYFYKNSAITEIVSFGNNWKETWYPSFRSSSLIKVPDYLPESITDLSNAFVECDSFNQDLRSWDWKNIEYGGAAFMLAVKYNQPIEINAPRLATAANMFSYCYRLNKPVTIAAPELTNLSNMFTQCTDLNSLVTITGDKLERMNEMFSYCQRLNVAPLMSTANVKNMAGMFLYAFIFNQPLTHFNVSKCENFQNMFYNATAFNQSLLSWTVTGSPIKTNFATDSGLTTAQIPEALR